MNNSGDIKFPAVVPAAIGGAPVQSVDARELHQFLDVGKDFSTWVRARISSYGFVEHTDYEVFPGLGENASTGRPTKEYALSIDMAKELCMVERNDKGKAARRYFIECERRMQAGGMLSIDTTPPLNDGISAVRETRYTFGKQAARQMWMKMGLPTVPAMFATSPQRELFPAS
jgi:anti-repressor protein